MLMLQRIGEGASRCRESCAPRMPDRIPPRGVCDARDLNQSELADSGLGSSVVPTRSVRSRATFSWALRRLKTTSRLPSEQFDSAGGIHEAQSLHHAVA